MQQSMPSRDAPWANANGDHSDSSTERGNLPPGSRGTATPPDASGDLVEPLTQALGEAKRIAALEWARAKLALRAQRRAALRGLYEVLVILALGLAGTIALVRGILGGLSDWLDSPWKGQLLGGVLILLAAVAIPKLNVMRRDKAHCNKTRGELCRIGEKE